MALPLQTSLVRAELTGNRLGQWKQVMRECTTHNPCRTALRTMYLPITVICSKIDEADYETGMRHMVLADTKKIQGESN